MTQQSVLNCFNERVETGYIRHISLIRPIIFCFLSLSSLAEPTPQSLLDQGGHVTLTGDITLAAPLRIARDDVTLCGPGRLIQEDPAQPVLVIENCKRVQVRDLTITRAAGKEDAVAGGLLISNCEDVVLDAVRIIGCRAREAALRIERCSLVTARNCVISNYKRVAIDDRTDSPLYGYAFKAIDGTGVMVDRSVHTSLIDNRIVDDHLLPTQEMKDAHGLGSLTEGKLPTKPGELGEGAVKSGYVSNWHQGSAIIVTGPAETRHTIVRGNHIVNAAQAVDLHCDYAVVSGNVIDRAMIGLKATHGCRGLVLSDNVITGVDLWGILLNPGAGSYAASADKAPNEDGGTVISGNVIADYGYGNEYWNWGGSHAIALYEGQLAENPPLRDVVVTGNIVYDSARERGEAPRHRYAVYIGPWSEGSPKENLPRGVVFHGNILAAGSAGVSNVPLPTQP